RRRDRVGRDRTKARSPAQGYRRGVLMNGGSVEGMNVNTLWARIVVDELARCGLRQVCISPGSRSTPLVMAFAGHETIEDTSIIDERSAAFFALGQALATGRPVALLCTSGTAAANFYPAVCEASRSQVPLVVLTADRPLSLQACGAPQAMDQIKLYGDHVRFFHQVDQAEATPEKLRYLRSLTCRAYHESCGLWPGPVHLNIPFRKPLEPTLFESGHRDSVHTAVADRATPDLRGRPGGAPFIEASFGVPQATPTVIDAFVARLQGARRPLILAGADRNGAHYAMALDAFARQIGAPVLAEATSGLRHTKPPLESVIAMGDFLFTSSFYDGPQKPDLIVRTGKAPLSWSASARLRHWADVDQIVLSPYGEPADPDHQVGWRIWADVASLCEAALATLSGHHELGEEHRDRTLWTKRHALAQSTALKALKGFPDESSPPRHQGFVVADVWAVLAASLPHDSGLFVSSSMPIRDLETFMASTEASVEIYFNRGINGIDGIVSTGLGVAMERTRRKAGPTVIVIGDVALRHDLSALLIAEELGVDATVLLLDNDGGGIFEYLPIADFGPHFEHHFATSGRRPLDASILGGLATYYEPQDWDGLRKALQASVESPGLQIVRVQTDRRRDKKARQKRLQSVAATIEKAVEEKGG
ncbi:MAG: 2-succinyl-5-enolpyruvyl-6-hydroxy-3-cyclohexene-1-carboxylic-acid synthase, partial [Bradymonadaceae bacterium]